ncbi:MAG TPA: hypothetical protein VHX38_23225 [Pseudonocardiaceae bacterium]|jgi:hypothetical protein|nr:hypothetical protein [Pseudonocardiaceae bacterium]
MRLVGSVGVLAGAQGARTSGNVTRDFGYQGPPWFALLLIYLGVLAVGTVVFVVSLPVGRLARAHLTHIVASVATLPPGSYVLYLRPFTEDLSAAGIAPGPNSSNPMSTITRSGRTYEERLGRMFREFGPLIAVGRPGEALPGGSGARRTYLPLDDWKDTVRELIDNARLIILGAGPGPGTVWEYVEILRRRDPSRLLLLVTDPVGYQRFAASSIAEAEGVLFELKHRYGEGWQAPILPDLPSPVNPKVTRAFYFKAMIYFSTGWEPHLAYFDRSAVKNSPRKVNKYYAKGLGPVMTHIRNGVLASGRAPRKDPF